jgi:hypothetical protein
MLKIYCSECGSPTEYSLNKPKFCTNCGNSFFGAKKEEKVALPVQMQKPTITRAKRPNIEIEDGYYIHIIYNSAIRKLSKI